MSKRTIHGIDLTAPGGIAALMDFHRLTFGDAVMEDDGGAADAAQVAADAAAKTTADAAAADAANADKQLGENGLKALAAERDARKAAEVRIKELEDASKSDEQKRAERFEQLEKSDGEKAGTIGSLENTILRYQVAAAKGLDLEAAERLRGTSKEEIEADADTWLSKWGSTKGPGVVPGVGAQGTTSTDVTPGIDRIRLGYESATK